MLKSIDKDLIILIYIKITILELSNTYMVAKLCYTIIQLLDQRKKIIIKVLKTIDNRQRGSKILISIKTNFL